MIRWMTKCCNDQSGAVLVTTVVGIMALIGCVAIVLDVALLYVNKVELSNIADSAALAGGQELPDSSLARQQALQYVSLNGGDPRQFTVATTSDNRSLMVTAVKPVDLFFARVLGFQTSTVSATAYVKTVAAGGANGVVPFGVQQQDFQYGQTYYLKSGADSGYDGNFGGLALGGNGASIYLNNIDYGYDGDLHVGDQVTTEPGNMSGPTLSGVQYRISQDSDSTYETVAKNSPRIITVPIINTLAVNGRSQVTIVGFAAFFLEGVGGNGTDNYVYGKFMEMAGPVEIDQSGQAIDFGLRGVQLTNSP